MLWISVNWNNFSLLANFKPILNVEIIGYMLSTLSFSSHKWPIYWHWKKEFYEILETHMTLKLSNFVVFVEFYRKQPSHVLAVFH